MKKGFTLEEVLITLGIIGIVAAMTMPALIQKHKKQEASARLKKFYSMMSQAVMQSEIDNGKIDTWDKTPLEYDENKVGLPNSDDTSVFFKKYLAQYIKYLSADKIEDGSGRFRVTLRDGSVMYLINGSCTDIAYDVNGDRQPNITGIDEFYFLICQSENNSTFNKQSFTA